MNNGQKFNLKHGYAIKNFEKNQIIDTIIEFEYFHKIIFAFKLQKAENLIF